MAEDTQTEEIAKYKRVLALARSSLEANQATIAVKDQQIAQLIKALEEEKSSNKTKKVLGKEEEAALIPRRILCRVDIEETIWILIEYDDCDDTWKSFNSEQDLEDFIQRVPGVPLTCPTRCLSSEESNRIMDESKKRIERIVEEFRRFKVRTEIAKKQKDAETRQAVMNGATSSSSVTSAPSPSSNYSNTSGLTGPLERALTLGTLDHTNGNGSGVAPTDELSRLRASLAEQEAKWRQSFEAIARENEILRSKGGESLLATQWRGRYEACMKEKEELAEKLTTYGQWTNNVTASGRSMDQAYIELQEEFRTFRRKLASIDRRRQRNTASAALSASSLEGADGTSLDSVNGSRNNLMTLHQESEVAALIREYEANSHHYAGHSSPRYGSTHTNHYHSNGRHRHGLTSQTQEDEVGADGQSGMTASKIKYVRHMILQYLSCKEPEVKLHMETALMTIFRLTPEEREMIENKRKEDATDALSSITNFLGSLGT